MLLDANKFRELVDAVLGRRRELKGAIESFGKKTIYDYANLNIENEYKCPFVNRFDEFIEVVKKEISRLFGADIAEKAAVQMKDFFSVSTADHHGPLTSPFFVSPNLICAGASGREKNFTIVFPGSNVSLSNSSLPRGLFYSTVNNNSVVTGRLSLIPSMVARNAASVYGFRPYNKADLERVDIFVDEEVKQGKLNFVTATKIKSIIEDVYNRPEVLSLGSYSDQITKTNFYLWKKFFPSKSNVADLLYVPMENIVVSALLEHHIGRPTVLNRAIFDVKYRKLVSELFNGIQGAFDLENKKGTYLFWGLLPKGNYMVSLWEKDNYLVDDSGEIKIEITPDAIGKALIEKRIVPSLLLDFICLSFYYGLRCFGGFNQINYVTEMKEQWIKLLQSVGEVEDLEALKRVGTNKLIGDLTVAYGKGPGGKLYPLAGLDLALYQQSNTWDIIKDMMKKVTVEEGIYPLLTEFYSIVVASKERQAELTAIKPDDVIEFLELEKKLSPCLEIGY